MEELSTSDRQCYVQSGLPLHEKRVVRMHVHCMHKDPIYAPVAGPLQSSPCWQFNPLPPVTPLQLLHPWQLTQLTVTTSMTV